MHELALTESVVEIAVEEARRAGASRILRIALDIGALSAVEPEAMRFCFAAVAAGTPAEDAALEISEIAGAGWCPDCEAAVPLTERFGACPGCGGYKVRTTGGGEMKVRELEVA